MKEDQKINDSAIYCIKRVNWSKAKTVSTVGSMQLPSIISFKLLHISYIQNLKALFLNDIWSHFLIHEGLKSLSALQTGPVLNQISPCLHRHVRPGNGFVPNFQLFERGDVNGNDEQALFTFLKVGHCSLDTIYTVFMQQIEYNENMCRRIGIKSHSYKVPLRCHIFNFGWMFS